MNLLLTGVNGFIGKHIDRYLSDEHMIVKIVSPRTHTECEHTFSVDLRDRQQVTKFLNEITHVKIDVIIHLGFQLVSGDNVKDMNVLYDNLKITECMVHVAKTLKSYKLINFSSMAVYPNENGKYSEKSEIRTSANTECLYGLSKFCAENIFDFFLKDDPIAISHLRVAQVYGEGMRKDRIIERMKAELDSNNTITVYGNGERISNFIGVQDLLRHIKAFLYRDLTGIYNVGKENLSYYDLAKRIIHEYGNNDSSIILQEKGSKARFCLDLNKLKSAIPNQ